MLLFIYCVTSQTASQTELLLYTRQQNAKVKIPVSFGSLQTS